MAKAPSIPKYNPPQTPNFVPLDMSAVNQQAIQADTQAYNLSDTAFQQQHPDLYSAQQAMQKQIATDMSGDQTLPPAVQNQMLSAGLQGAVGSMGATGAFGTDSSTTGAADPTAGQSAVARNFGLNVANYLQNQKQTAMQETMAGTEMFPEREFGIGGQGMAQGMISENANLNNFNWGVYGADVQGKQFQANQAAQQAGLQAGASNANTGAMASVGGAVAGAALVAAVA